ncbi:SsgA family sporulation/cell division regulator [Streptomyces sp. NBC_00316]|uniref:SsgA family sporulation/cell division regulator n=1 Tax=Streptomyces sp. NBC_00316 TaxID=2975710 RepID=UPI002E2A5E68|nr:SsgA family sporulation/cell division regulator [Streptomyces sp. NBC_00316]
MSLRYEPTDPHVVRAVFLTVTEEPADWVLRPDLLADGLRGSASSGDSRIWPAVGRGGEAMCIALGSPADAALLEFPVRDIRTFLEHTEALVPRGTESGHIDWNLELANPFAKG